jgi:threonylcarbamoyladenosine tRNA methylthiotransferase MtaB
MKRIAFHTFGCKLNFAETSTITRDFSGKNFTIVDFNDNADFYIIHSCIVTGNAEKKCIAAIKQARRKCPESQIAVIGCMSELSREKLENLGMVDFIIGNNEKYSLHEILSLGKSDKEITVGSFVSSYSVEERTRSFIKIQDGCDYFCSYCTIPLARGRSRSDFISNIIRIADEISLAGVKEIVLTGVNIGDFGKHNNESFKLLLQNLETKTTIPRIRFSSIEPDLCTDDIIELVADSKKILPHFHIPLQSGSDKILKLMNRKYSTQLFSEKVKKIKDLMPDSCIATDLITGFPGETEEDFNDTYKYLQNLELSYIHVFTYSERNNTRSSKMEGKINGEEKKRRSKLLHELSEEKKAIFYKNNSGKTKKVLFESDISKGFIHGFTENYIKVRAVHQPSLINNIFDVELVNLNTDLIFDCKIIH